jgi:hypothetical protein
MLMVAAACARRRSIVHAEDLDAFFELITRASFGHRNWEDSGVVRVSGQDV